MSRRARVVLLVSLASCAKAPSPAPAAPSGEFRMRKYVVVLLRRGPAWSAEKSAESAAIFQGHMAHLDAMAAAGKMVLAGPFDAPAGGEIGTPAGLCIYTVEAREEAERLASEDPAVKAGRFTIEALPWYGPADITYPGMDPFLGAPAKR